VPYAHDVAAAAAPAVQFDDLPGAVDSRAPLRTSTFPLATSSASAVGTSGATRGVWRPGVRGLLACGL
jgi:hypothetical protein